MICVKKQNFIENLGVTPPLILTAPIAGYTTYSFRKIIKRFNPDIVYTEMLSIKSVIYNNKAVYKIIKKDTQERNIGIQLFGSEPEEFVKSIEIIKSIDPTYEVFDINMGCPVKKVTKTGAGSALLKDPENIYKIIRTIKTNFPDIVLSAKIRIGFDNNSKNYMEVSKAIEEGDADFITVHGRTRTQFYSGDVDYDAIAKIKESLKIPVIANGNIFTPEDAKRVLEYTNADGIMLARGIIGNPFLISQIREFMDNKNYKKPSIPEIVDTMISHFELEKDDWAEFKKICICYIKGFPNSAGFKKQLVTSRSLEDLEKTIKEIKEYYGRERD